MPWIFTYGSLMWTPGFPYEKRVKAVLHGYHREFNVTSTVRWGTPEQPAPTLGLEDGGTTTGIAYHVADDEFEDVMRYLRKREGPGFAFPEVPVELADTDTDADADADAGGETVDAVVAVNEHSEDEGYIGHMSVAERAQMAADAAGEAGTGREYVLNTYDQIKACGIEDEHVKDIAARVRALAANTTEA